MKNSRPYGVGLFVICSVLTGIIVGYYGIAYATDGAAGLRSPRNTHLLDEWGGYFRTYIWVGIVWMVTGLGSFVSAIGLWQGREWGRKLAIVSNVGHVAGWLIIKIACRGFGNPPPLVIIILALPSLYLFAREVRDYCHARPNPVSA